MENPIKDYGGSFISAATTVPFVLIFGFMTIALLNTGHMFVVRKNVNKTQQALSRALVAYTTAIDYDLSVESIADGWLTTEDEEVYDVTSNAFTIDKRKGTSFFNEIFASGAGKPISEIAPNTSVMELKTTFRNGSPHFRLKFPEGGFATGNSLDEIQIQIENKYGVKIDLAKNFDPTIKQAIEAHDVDGNKFSSYTTVIGLLKQIDIVGLFRKETRFNEIQTYTLRR